jgi:unspecific monooxygenase
VWEVIWLYKVRVLNEQRKLFNHPTEMKLVVAAIYTNFRTTIVNDDGIEAIDAYTVKPKGEKLILRFEYI